MCDVAKTCSFEAKPSYMIVKGMKVVVESEAPPSPDALIFGTRPSPASSPAARMAAHVSPRNDYAPQCLIASFTWHNQPSKAEHCLQIRRNGIKSIVL